MPATDHKEPEQAARIDVHGPEAQALLLKALQKAVETHPKEQRKNGVELALCEEIDPEAGAVVDGSLKTVFIRTPGVGIGKVLGIDQQNTQNSNTPQEVKRGNPVGSSGRANGGFRHVALFLPFGESPA